MGLISDVLAYGRLWYGEPDAISNAIGSAKFCSWSHDAAIHVHDAGKVIALLGDAFPKETLDSHFHGLRQARLDLPFNISFRSSR